MAVILARLAVMRPSLRWGAAIVIGLALGSAARAQLSPRQFRPEPAPPPARQVPQPAAFPLGPAAGLCQCISDRTRVNISCLGGRDACQSVCGTTHYSLIPDAAFTCPLASGEQPSQQPLTQ
jgi:hypothetical protein